MNEERRRCSVEFSRASGPDSPITISVDDPVSGIRHVDIEMAPAEFAKAVIGLGGCPGTYILRGLALYGATREYKNERVAVRWTASEEERRAALARHEVDGWRGRLEDTTNHHMTVADGLQEVGFERWMRDGQPIVDEVNGNGR